MPPVLCPITNPLELRCPLDTKYGQTIDPNGCLIWTCVPMQPYCCPSVELIKCENEFDILDQILDLKTGCKIFRCVPKQPYCCPELSLARKCFKPNQNVEVYDRETGCLYIQCAALREVPLKENCTMDTKPGLIFDYNDNRLVWTCVPNQPKCCPKPTKEMQIAKCSDGLELQQVMDPITGCKYWDCVPKQPYCCKKTYPLRNCKPGTYNSQVYDIKTGCLVWQCVPSGI